MCANSSGSTAVPLSMRSPSSRAGSEHEGMYRLRQGKVHQACALMVQCYVALHSSFVEPEVQFLSYHHYHAYENYH